MRRVHLMLIAIVLLRLYSMQSFYVPYTVMEELQLGAQTRTLIHEGDFSLEFIGSVLCGIPGALLPFEQPLAMRFPYMAASLIAFLFLMFSTVRMGAGLTCSLIPFVFLAGAAFPAILGSIADEQGFGLTLSSLSLAALIWFLRTPTSPYRALLLSFFCSLTMYEYASYKYLAAVLLATALLACVLGSIRKVPGARGAALTLVCSSALLLLPLILEVFGQGAASTFFDGPRRHLSGSQGFNINNVLLHLQRYFLFVMGFASDDNRFVAAGSYSLWPIQGILLLFGLVWNLLRACWWRRLLAVFCLSVPPLASLLTLNYEPVRMAPALLVLTVLSSMALADSFAALIGRLEEIGWNLRIVGSAFVIALLIYVATSVNQVATLFRMDRDISNSYAADDFLACQTASWAADNSIKKLVLVSFRHGANCIAGSDGAWLYPVGFEVESTRAQLPDPEEFRGAPVLVALANKHGLLAEEVLRFREWMARHQLREYYSRAYLYGNTGVVAACLGCR